jgi:hypothetical protein
MRKARGLGSPTASHRSTILALHAGLLAVLVQEHRRYGDLEGGVEGEHAWMTSDCGGSIRA